VRDDHEARFDLDCRSYKGSDGVRLFNPFGQLSLQRCRGLSPYWGREPCCQAPLPPAA
jgi:hypothetical protein